MKEARFLRTGLLFFFKKKYFLCDKIGFRLLFDKRPDMDFQIRPVFPKPKGFCQMEKKSYFKFDKVQNTNNYYPNQTRCLMKSLSKLLFLALFLISAGMNIVRAEDTEEEIKRKLPMIYGANNVGKDFWFSIPPVYDQASGGDNYLKFFIISPVKTVVHFEVPALGINYTYDAKPNQVVPVNLTPASIQPFYHGDSQKSPPTKVYSGRGLHIYSKDPLVVYVMARYVYTSDGFLAIPTNALGKNYVVAAFPEMGWNSGSNGGHFPPWVMITAPYENTDVTFTMGGSFGGNDALKMPGGKKVKTGETIKSPKLKKGDVWCLTIENFFNDPTGSKVTSNKPISMVCGHFCPNIPVGNQWCDYSVEAVNPAETWGTTIHVPMIPKRRYSGLIRLFAKEDDTDIYRDGAFFTNIAKAGGAGEGTAYAEERVWPFPDWPKRATFTANKPFNIVYYNPGVQEDGAGGLANVNSDPFWMAMTPVEQYQNEIIFCTPNSQGGTPFTENYMNLVFELNEFGLMPEDMEFGEVLGETIDWTPVSAKFGASFEVMHGEYKGKKYGTKVVTLPSNGVFKVRSPKQKFSCYSFGYSSYDSYGFPTSAGLANLEFQDTLPPTVIKDPQCDGTVKGATVTDQPFPGKNSGVGKDPERSEMHDIYMITSESYNYEYEYTEFIPGEVTTTTWSLKVEDLTKDARAVLLFTDKAGNETLDTTIYTAPKMAIDMPAQGEDFGQFKNTDGSVTRTYTVRNLSETSSLELTKLNLKSNNQGFSYKLPGWSIPASIEPLGSRPIEITFTPSDPNIGDKVELYDSIGIGTECVFAYYREARALMGAPCIAVGDWKFPPVRVGNPQTKNLAIKNDGNAPLRITGYSGPAQTNFKLLTVALLNASPANPVIIAAGQVFPFDVEFTPTADITYVDQIVFTSDAPTTCSDFDPVCLLEGSGTSANLTTVGYDWKERTIDRPAFPRGPYDTKEGGTQVLSLVFENSGTNAVKINGIALEASSVQGDALAFLDINGNPLATSPLFGPGKMDVPGKDTDGNPGRFEVPVLFRPRQLGPHFARFTFSNTENVSVSADFAGVGIAPVVDVTDVAYAATIVQDVNNPSAGTATITNTLHDYDDVLTITDIQGGVISENMTTFGSTGFRFDKSAITFPIELQPGETYQIPGQFVSTSANAVSSPLTLVSDAYDAGSGIDAVSNWTGSGLAQSSTISGDNGVTCINSSLLLTSVYTNTGDLPVNVTFSVEEPNSNPAVTVNLLTPNATSVAPGATVNVQMSAFASAVVTNYTFQIVATTDEVITSARPSNIYKADVIVSTQAFTRTSSATVSIPESRMGTEFKYTMALDGSTDITPANVSAMNVEIRYKKDYIFGNAKTLKAIGQFAGFSVENLESNKVDDLTGERIITFSLVAPAGEVFATQGGAMAEITFISLLPSFDELTKTGVIPTKEDIRINHTITVDDAGCYTPGAASNPMIDIAEICVPNLRSLIITGKKFNSGALAPSPVTASGANINYSVPYELPVTINVYASSGELISTVVDGKVQTGDHSIALPIEKMTNGAYFYEMVAGPYKASHKFVVNK